MSQSIDIDEYFEMWVLLHQTKDAVFNARSKALSKFGITPREAAILHAIHSIGEEVTPIKISRWTYRKPNTIKDILDRMERKSLIIQKKDLKYRNMISIKLTEKGKQAYKNSRKRLELTRIFKSLPDEECNKFISNLTLIRDKALKETEDSIQRPFP